MLKKTNTKQQKPVFELNICAETKTQVFRPQNNHPHTLFMDFDIIQHSVCRVPLQLSNVWPLSVWASAAHTPQSRECMLDSFMLD